MSIVDMEDDPRTKEPSISDWGPHLIAFGGNPKEEDHTLLVDTFLKMPMLTDKGQLEPADGFCCGKCKATFPNKLVAGKVCETCYDGIVVAATTPAWP
eukprot:14326916-Heterocapsa_arctica.AAC.1